MRQVIDLNRGWKFIREDAGLPDALPDAWEDVNLPHCWNAIDGMDGNGTYYRGRCWYAKSFDAPRQPLAGGRVYAEVGAAGQQAAIYCNGVKLAYHEGGYSIFRADLTDVLKEDGENLLVIACDNSYLSNVYPQSADFTFYGGLYRGVKLISVPEVHFDLDYYGGPALTVSSAPCECGGAEFRIETWVTKGAGTSDDFFGRSADAAASLADYTVLYSITDADGREAAGACRPADDAAVKIYVPDVHLWDVEDPYLYTVTATLQRRNEACDEISTRAGVRSFSVDPQKGFFLNGRSLPLRGVSRHQDLLYQGNALSREDHYRDARIIKELGANTIRLAHYQHSQDFYDACDELGFIVWAEIPFISALAEDPKAHDNCESQMTELIVQNYNHPSICFWGLSNEVLIGGITQELVDNHVKLEKLVKSLDSTRLTTIAHVGQTPLECPLHHITDVISYNLYYGWYVKKIEDNGPWLDYFHELHPDLCIGMSEYGCEGILTYHSADPARSDYSEEYQALYHEKLAQVFDERPWVWASHVWNMFDFGCALRNEGGVAGRNNKGLVTNDRKTRKDAFYVYQAYWSKKPMVHIAGRRYAQRAGEKTEVKVYSNQSRVMLYLNGKPAGIQSGYRVFRFTVSLEEGQNILVAVAECTGKGSETTSVPSCVKDSITLEKVEKEPDIYVLPSYRERTEEVANWFTATGTMDLEAPMEFPEGRYNVRDTMYELAKSPEAWLLAARTIKLATNRVIEPDGPMWDFMGPMTFAGMQEEGRFDGMPKGFLASLNAQLTRIERVD